MARKASVRYWASRGTWTDSEGKSRKGAYCVTIDGKQHVLAAGPHDWTTGPTYLRALKAYRDLLDISSAADRGADNTARVVFEHYLRDLEPRVRASTLKERQCDLAAFCATPMGDWPVSRLTTFAVKEWLRNARGARQIVQAGIDGRERVRTYQWGEGKEARVIITLQAALNWGADTGLIPKNPLASLKAPARRSRSRDCLVSPADHERALAIAKGKLRDFLVCLSATGARPSELLNATAKDWRDDLAAFVLHADRVRQEGELGHKTAGKGKERRIFFPPDAARIIRERIARYPSGPLWQAGSGRSGPWTLRRVECGFQTLGRKLGLKHFTPYSYRHTFATRWLEAGRSIDDLAALLGNTPEVIRRHYSHVADDLSRLKKLAEGFSGGGSESPPRVLPFSERAG